MSGQSFITGARSGISFINRFELSVPLIQAPMAGVATPSLAATVSEAGALGSIGVGATDAVGAWAMIEEVRSRTTHAFNVNGFVHAGGKADLSREAQWLDWLAPVFAEYGPEPPRALMTIYKSFADDPDMVAALLHLVVSFHFGLPSTDVLSTLRTRGIYLMATATSLDEARVIEAAGSTRWSCKGSRLAGIGVSSTPPRPTTRSARSR